MWDGTLYSGHSIEHIFASSPSICLGMVLRVLGAPGALRSTAQVPIVVSEAGEAAGKGHQSGSWRLGAGGSPHSPVFIWK